MANLKNVREYIRALEHVTGFLRQLLEEEKRVIPPPPTDNERVAELTDLRMMTRSNIWPMAVEPELICEEGDEKDKFLRAYGIIREFMRVDLNFKKFLDFGCGEGHVPYAAVGSFNAKYGVGYDIEPQGWEHFEYQENFLLTRNIQAVFEHSPYDVVLLNDVIDHCDDPVDLLKTVKRAKTPEGTVHVRCHPWTSRHGTHLYHQLNRAYLHLVFTPEELIGMGLKEMKTLKLLDPLNDYKRFFREAGLNVIKESAITQPIETFFITRPPLLRRIKDNWKASTDAELKSGKKFPHEQMELQFIDFVLQ